MNDKSELRLSRIGAACTSSSWRHAVPLNAKFEGHRQLRPLPGKPLGQRDNLQARYSRRAQAIKAGVCRDAFHLRCRMGSHKKYSAICIIVIHNSPKFADLRWTKPAPRFDLDQQTPNTVRTAIEAHLAINGAICSLFSIIP